MKGIVISSGSIENYDLLKKHIKDNQFILCADGGVRHIMRIGAIPNSVIGDFDSIDEKSVEFIKENNIPVLKYPVEKDETDTELALMHLINIGCNEITLVGVTGCRLDHTLANIYLLRKLLLQNIKGKIVDDNNTIYLINDYLKLEKRENYYVSIIPISNEGVIVTLKGFYYPLDDKLIEFNSTLGISNRIIDKFGEIKIIRGEALIIESKD